MVQKAKCFSFKIVSQQNSKKQTVGKVGKFCLNWQNPGKTQTNAKKKISTRGPILAGFWPELFARYILNFCMLGEEEKNWGEIAGNHGNCRQIADIDFASIKNIKNGNMNEGTCCM